jgi:hypothetical protein
MQGEPTTRCRSFRTDRNAVNIYLLVFAVGCSDEEQATKSGYALLLILDFACSVLGQAYSTAMQHWDGQRWAEISQAKTLLPIAFKSSMRGRMDAKRSWWATMG